jgi:hypothetical protein
LVPRLGDALQDNIHLTFWQADERTDAGVPDGWGAQFSFSRRLRKRWLPFLRIGYANGSAAALDRSLSTGFAYDAPGPGTVFGLSVNWGRSNRSGSGTATATEDHSAAAPDSWKQSLQWCAAVRHLNVSYCPSSAARVWWLRCRFVSESHIGAWEPDSQMQRRAE